MQDMESILRAIPQGQRVEFDKALVRRLYARHQSRQIDDTRAVEELAGLMAGRKLLVLAPGESLRTRETQVLGFIQREHPLVLAVNFADPKFQVEVCFVSSHKRLDIAGARLRELPGVRRVFTSNLAARADPDCLLVDYDRYLNSDPMVADNAGLMLLKLLARCGARQAVLAGFDGFLGRGYYSREATLALNDADALERQRRIGEQLSLLPLELTFLTPSAYEGKGVAL